MRSKPPEVEIISTGTEILQGLYADQNASDLSRLLDAEGFRVRFHHAARDHAGDLGLLLASAAARSDLIVMTGGLGPTEDDVNRDVVARVWDAPARLDPRAEQMMRERFEMRGLPMPERNVVQAMIPRGATVFYNYEGTAPGFAIPPAEDSNRRVRAALIALPGPPKEWTPMWEADAVPWLRSEFPGRPRRKTETLHVAMLPESTVNERLKHLFSADPRMEVTLLAARGHIRVRLVVTADAEEEADDLLRKSAREALERIPPDHIMNARVPRWSLEQELHELLAAGGRVVTVAESCTGGMIAARITDVPGASAFFHQGFVVYSNEAKRDLLGVRPETLESFGAVSRECVEEMAKGARKRTDAAAALAVSGIAGPSGGAAEKPVGVVCFAVDSADRGTCSLRRRFPGNREAVREWATRQGLDLLRRWAANLPWPE